MQRLEPESADGRKPLHPPLPKLKRRKRLSKLLGSPNRIVKLKKRMKMALSKSNLRKRQLLSKLLRRI
jgi:hypothetical protein